MPSVYCPRCRILNDSSSRYCRECGYRLDQLIVKIILLVIVILSLIVILVLLLGVYLYRSRARTARYQEKTVTIDKSANCRVTDRKRSMT
jgi:hypothetical protein